MAPASEDPVGAGPLASYRRPERRALPNGRVAIVKPGVRGWPDLAPGAELLIAAGGEETLAEVLDLSASAGAAAAALVPATGAAWRVLEPSAAGLACATVALSGLAGVELAAGLPWDAPEASCDRALLLPPADRGNARVEAELAAAARALRPGGTVWLAMHKDRGAKRYEKLASNLIGPGEVVRRSRGWRLSRWRRGGDPPRAPEPRVFDAAGLEVRAWPGVFAAGKLDPGTAELLAAFEAAGARSSLDGARVLDLGCGYGVLALFAANAGARVTALDDDLAAVRSARVNAAAHDRTIDVRHSDVDAALEPSERFDAVLCNPPFHVGKRVRLELPRAFLAAAGRRLVAGGVLWLVANRALGYEAELERWGEVRLAREAGGFKVLVVRKR